MRLLFLISALALAACSSGGSSSAPPSVPVATVNGWTATSSPGATLVAKPGALFSVAIPAAVPPCPDSSGNCDRLGYVTEAAPALQLGQTIAMAGSITASADAVFNYTTNPDNPTTASGHPSSCRIFIQEAGDNGTGVGAYAYYRWWANDPADVVLGPGPFSISATLLTSAGGGWTSVNGEQATNSATATSGFQQAVASASTIGFTCGGGSFYGHGVNMSQGSATFTLNSFTVQ